MNLTLDYYRKHGKMTEIGTMKHMVKDLPQDITGIVATVQNLLIHQHWARRYGLDLEEKRKEELLLRRAEEKLIFIHQKGYQQVTDKIPLEDKMVGICRDFSVMAAALCIEAGIPARPRCGFATYFETGKYIDHWILEYWHEREGRWVMVDAQLDDFQQQQLEIQFNPLDVDEKSFINGPRAWKMCRRGELNPELFGIFQWWGYKYLASNLILDANALLKVPMQPWDEWEGYKALPIEAWTEADYLKMDQLAELMLSVDDNFHDFQKFMQKNEKLRVPEGLV